MKEKIILTNDHRIHKVKEDIYLSIELVDSTERAILREKPNFSEEDINRIIENHKPKMVFSRLKTDNNCTLVSPAKWYHLYKSDFLPWVDPFGLDPFPSEGIEIMTDIIGEVNYIQLPANESIDSESPINESIDDDSDLPF